jgi:hypothetical protein
MLPLGVLVDTSDGFVDFTFPIAESKYSDDGQLELRLAGILLQRPVEFIVRIESGIPANDLDAPEPEIYAKYDGVSFSFDGEGGRNLALAISTLYQIPRSSFQMPVNLSMTAVNLSGNPANLTTEIVKFKLFHETGSTDEEEGPDYFEMYLHVDLSSGTIALNEKDTDYRFGVLNSLPPEPS